MVEYVYSKPKKSHFKLIVISIVLVLVVISIIGFSQYSGTVPSLGIQTETSCSERMSEVCNACFFINDYRFDIWQFSGVGFDRDVVECANKYFEANWSYEQDCTGKTIEKCLLFVKE
ncbi:MAG: hypothetical protein CW691_06985 [Candidatus Bathyarchaeum sp.]|nr:MAG: hypothetical protein CW691_06985 [Candidatus Bathyarchaeum sp.]